MPPAGPAPGPGLARPSIRGLLGNRLDYDTFKSRASDTPPSDASATDKGPAASADFGQSFRYDVAEPVTLPRLKTALLAVVDAPVEAARVRVYNPAVLRNHPVLGVRLKNTTAAFLAQGPVAVFDDGTYAGDGRLPDVKPGESRLLSYAVDLTLDAEQETSSLHERLAKLYIVHGSLHEEYHIRRQMSYFFRNRTPDPRVVLVTHPANTEWKLVDPADPAERTADLYRFEAKVAGGG